MGLTVSHLRKVYRRSGREIVAADDVSFQVRAGEVVGLLGPNGAGKTTTIKCILGLLVPTAGSVRICGFDPRRQARQALRRVGAMLEGTRNLHWSRSALENLLFFANLAGIPTTTARARSLELLERYRLLDRAGSLVGQLSRGMQQKLALCAALVRDPEVLLLDEPTLGLDVEAALDVRQLLLELARERARAVLVASHDMRLVESVCGRVIVLHRGRVLADEEVPHLLEMLSTRSYRFVVEGSLTGRAREAIFASFTGAEVTAAEGRTVIEVTVERATRLYDLVELLRDHGAALASVDHRAPDLEQVFLHLIRGGQEARAGASRTGAGLRTTAEVAGGAECAGPGAMDGCDPRSTGEGGRGA
ncbi:MAG: ABC transporter ATP-binding protein [Bacillota bacterium]